MKCYEIGIDTQQVSMTRNTKIIQQKRTPLNNKRIHNDIGD